MKKLQSLLVVAFVAVVLAMLGIHWKQVQSVEQSIGQAKAQAERQELTGQLILDLEKYRRTSGTFRKLSEADIVSKKTALRNEFKSTLARLEALDPNGKKLTDQLMADFGEFQVLSAKLEPTLFLRDVYQKPPIQELHKNMIDGLEEIREAARAEGQAVQARLSGSAANSVRLLALAGMIAIVLFALVILQNYLSLIRPIRRLHGWALDVRNGKATPTTVFKGIYGEIQSVLSGLNNTVAQQRAERQQFINSIALDLRAPLISLQAGADQIAQTGETQGMTTVRRSLFKISRTLEGLTDILEGEYTQIRLDERIVDLRELVLMTSTAIGGPGSHHEVGVALPSAPIWASVDSSRLERVLINVISKLSQYQPQGGKIRIEMNQQLSGPFRGLEVVIRDAESAQGRAIATGPEQDLLRHWSSENGFGMKAAYRIMKAHGGSITASGLAGTRVHFTIRLPQERIASSIGSAQVAPAAFEAPGIKAMLSQQAVNFSS